MITSKIPNELLEKYGVQDINVLVAISGENMGELIHYNDFLDKTDHIPLKIFENFIENMAAASILEMPSAILEFFKDVKITYVNVLTARKTAREKINEIKASTETTE